MNYLLRQWQTTDAQTLAQYANNPAIANNMTDQFPHPYTLENAQQFISMAQSHTPARILAIEIQGKAAGGIGLHPQADVHRNNAELGYWLAEPFWGQGIITKAVREMVQYGFENFEITRIFARPYGKNIASQRVLEKAGFILEARLEKTLIKNNVLEDELIYAVRKS